MAIVSLIMSTYNGEQFIKEQLDSLLRQTRQPDEVIIIDDCSTDGTCSIISEFINSNGLEWTLIRNRQNVGWRNNFFDAINKATGDYIFLCDQDDIWFEDKIRLMSEILDQHSDIHVLACNLIPKYENGASPIASFYVKNHGKDYISPVLFDGKSFEVPRPGCTMCFKRTLIPAINTIKHDGIAHDAVLWIIGMVTDSAFIVNEPLIFFRRHGHNSSPNNAKNIQVRCGKIAAYIERASILLEHAEFLQIDDLKKKKIQQLIDFYAQRLEAIRSGSIFRVLLLLIHIHRYESVKTWGGDLISTLRK